MENNFFDEEERCGYIVSSQMKKVWNKEIELLIVFDKICKKYNLKYIVDSGTLLGAIRHDGFIPWDDDIDVAMPREDYNKLKKIIAKELESPYFFQSAYSDKGYWRGHAQLRNSYTTAILKNEGFDRLYNQGIFIDVFPLDYVSKFNVFNKIRCRIVKRFYDIFNIYYEKQSGKIKNIAKKIIKCIPFKIYYVIFENLLSFVPFKSNKIANVEFYKNVDEYRLVDCDIFDNIYMHKFENIEVPVPQKYDSVLKAYYGDDYMVMKQISTDHGNVIFDTSIGYKEYLSKFKE